MVFMYPQRPYGGFGYPRGYFDWDDPFEYYDAPAARSSHGPAKRRSDDFVEREDSFELHLDARRVRPSDISISLDTKTRTLTVAVAPAVAFAQPARLEFQLPDEAATEGIKSTLIKDGTLKIIIPKAVRQMEVDVRPRPMAQQAPQQSTVPQRQPQQPQPQRTHPETQSQSRQSRPEPPKQSGPKKAQKQPSKDKDAEDEWWKRDQVLEELSPEEAAARASLLANADSDSEGESDEDMSDMFDEEDAFRVSIDIRGFSPAEVSVAMDDADGVLTVSGEHEDRTPEGHLIATNSFKRSFVLPSACDAANVGRDDSLFGIVKVSVGKK
jgi:HSP20 family molecular chaperone IbpA